MICNLLVNYWTWFTLSKFYTTSLCHGQLSYAMDNFFLLNMQQVMLMGSCYSCFNKLEM